MYMCVYACMYVCMYMCVYACMYVCVCGEEGHLFASTRIPTPDRASRSRVPVPTELHSGRFKSVVNLFMCYLINKYLIYVCVCVYIYIEAL
jgi:hypothetical protein